VGKGQTKKNPQWALTAKQKHKLPIKTKTQQCHEERDKLAVTYTVLEGSK
jgi:hypothetical protein